MAGLVQMKDMFGPDDVVVVIFHDHGTRYLGKMFNDDWMLEKGFLDRKGLTARDVVSTNKQVQLHGVELNATVETAARLMRDKDFSQLPVTDGGRIVGSLNEQAVFECITRNPEGRTGTVSAIMQPAFPFADITTPVESLSEMITPANPAVLVRDFKTDQTYIITRHDIIKALC
jgi:cystathionine beta-synthase